MSCSQRNRIDFERISAENLILKDRILGYQETIHGLRGAIKKAQTSKEKQAAIYKSTLAQKDAIIKELSNQVAHLTALTKRDSTNTGTPTAATPIHQNKRIPNSRRATNKKKGGQIGHKKHTMESFKESEVTDYTSHELEVSNQICDSCNGELEDTNNYESKDEFDVQIKVVKRRHKYHIYQCVDCGREYRHCIEARLKETNQYGPTVQATALSLMVTGNVAMNKVRMLMNGMTEGAMNLSEGYISKLYKRAAQFLTGFTKDLKTALIQRRLLYWDDTVIMVKKKRACMRFYGDEQISYYTAHMSKNLESIIEDDILTVLTKDTTVMHDHNKVNYNKQFCFQNIECIQHLERDLQKVADDNPSHTWSSSMKKLIGKTIKERKEMLDKKEETFSKEYQLTFKTKMRKLIEKGYEESSKSTNPTTIPSESTLLKRIEEYFDNYFKWVEEFQFATTNNLSERGLRGIKSHLKISGQFDNENTATYYAIVKTYVETCRKNGINELIALSKLCMGTPIPVIEILK